MEPESGAVALPCRGLGYLHPATVKTSGLAPLCLMGSWVLITDGDSLRDQKRCVAVESSERPRPLRAPHVEGHH